MTKQEPTIDVAVVGAGPSGLMAANICQSEGRSVVVLEGRDRVGGRLLSVPVSDEPDAARLDLGATWFWANEPLVNKLIGDRGLPTFQQHLGGDTMFQGEQGTERIPGNRLDVPSGRLMNGTQSIAETLNNQLDDDVMQFGHSVQSVSVDGDVLVIASQKRKWVCRQLIVAVPPATAVANVDFHGGVDDDLMAIANATPVWMGNIVKVVAHYDRPFWREAGLAGAAFSYAGPLREIHDMSGDDGTPAALFGFAQPGAGNPTPTKDKVLDQLADLFGPEARQPTTLLIQDWRTEPLTSPETVDALTDYSTYGNPLFSQAFLDGRAHWASTETATTAPGHIEGALQAGSRAASNALRQLAAV